MGRKYLTAPLYMRISRNYIDGRLELRMRFLVLAALLVSSAGLSAGPALAADNAIKVVLKNHRFMPAEIHVKANQPALIALFNQDPAAEEFDSTSLKVEKVVAGNSSGNVRIRALAPGRYPFMGEYHSATAQGVVIAE